MPPLLPLLPLPPLPPLLIRAVLIAEAQALTGLSREFLLSAINKGELKAKVIGKGWRVKRSDLEEYVDKLFSSRQTATY